jgi:hypothetical protein
MIPYLVDLSSFNLNDANENIVFKSVTNILAKNNSKVINDNESFRKE